MRSEVPKHMDGMMEIVPKNAWPPQVAHMVEAKKYAKSVVALKPAPMVDWKGTVKSVAVLDGAHTDDWSRAAKSVVDLRFALTGARREDAGSVGGPSFAATGSSGGGVGSAAGPSSAIITDGETFVPSVVVLKFAITGGEGQTAHDVEKNAHTDENTRARHAT
jgi:hypothetical protein